MIIPLADKLVDCIINQWNVDKMKTKQMHLVCWILNSTLLKEEENVQKVAHNNPVDITPESLHSLVMNGFSSDVAASI